MGDVEREILLSFWKVHILHHASVKPISGQWIMRELRRHGYEVSPGTLYPLLARMEARGWLRSRTDTRGGPRARKDYSLAREGGEVLVFLRNQVHELYQEVVRGKAPAETKRERR
jgi:DNA-binding PadR family transcriptional regulator